MKLTAFLTGSEAPDIRPAPLERAWMDATPEGFAYRCLPLNIANAHGWEVLCPERIRARWFGGREVQSLSVETAAPKHLAPVSHFGSGILTFHVHFLVRTAPGIDLFVSGSPNHVKHGIQPLTGIVETDWSPFTFTMNWKFTAPGDVVFEKGEPFCFFFPIERALAERTEPEMRPLKDDPELEREFRAWQAARAGFNRDLKVEGSQARAERWQRTYFRGQRQDGSAGADDHRTRLRLKPFVKA